MANPTPEVRWRVLSAVHAGSWIGVNMNQLRYALSQTTPAGTTDIRDALHYLRGKGYVEYADTPAADKFTITCDGNDYVAGHAPDQPGIARPRYT